MNTKRSIAHHYLCGIAVLVSVHGMSNLQARQEAQSRLETSYGRIVGTYDDYIKGALVDKIELYAQKADESDQIVERNGLLVHYKDAEATVLMCHGFMCNKFDQGALRSLFPRGRFNIMSFDFRAHGEKTEGQICTFGKDEAYDVIAAAKFLKNHALTKDKPIIGYGFSMGAVAIIEAQTKDPSLFSAVILDCPFDSSENVLRRSLELVKLSVFGYSFNVPLSSVLQKYAFHPYIQSLVRAVLKTVANMDSRHVPVSLHPVSPVESIKTVSIPSFFILCKNDERVSVAAIKNIYKGSAANYKLLWLTNGRNHFDSFFYSPETYTDRVRTFLDDALSGKLYVTKREEIIEDADDKILSSANQKKEIILERKKDEKTVASN